MWNFPNFYTSIKKNCGECKTQLMNRGFNNIQSEGFNSCENVNDSRNAKKFTNLFKYKYETLSCYMCFHMY
jgi:hypothetical protein